MKKVIMLLVDSLMPGPLDQAFRHKTAPALKFLKDRGRYWANCVTVFPTMTASVDSSLVTGVYPDEHRVPGLIWFDPEEQKIINYINGWKCVKKLGVSACARNALYLLNEKHLSKQVRTVFEELSSRGRTSAAVNAMVHRGFHKHRVRPPFFIDVATRFQMRGNISGPERMTLGAMVENGMDEEIPPSLVSFRQAFGISDAYAVHVARRFVQSGQQPDFMLVYLPDNDHKVHRKNPDHAEEPLMEVDRKIQQILEAFGNWDEAVKQCVFIIISDHGQTRIGPNASFNIDLDRLLRPFRVLQLGQEVADHEVAVANNERMAYIYPLKSAVRDRVIRQLTGESRLDIIAWKEDRGVRVREGGSGRELYYAPGGTRQDTCKDPYDQTWYLSGEPAVLDLCVRDRRVEYGDYPDVLARLYGALYAQDFPSVVITSRPRFEFKSRYYPTHLDGGSHGSLHRYDSLVPLIVAGTDHPVREPPRLVDLKRLVLELLDGEHPDEKRPD